MSSAFLPGLTLPKATILPEALESIFMNNEALAIKDRHKVSIDVKEDECLNCEVCMQ